MTILTRYITKEVLINCAAVTTVLLLVVASGRVAYYLSYAVSGELDAEGVTTIIINLQPAYISYLLPFGGFIGLIVALGRMSVDNELSILYANSVSPTRLLGMLAVPMTAIAVIVALMSLVVAPSASRVVEEVLYVQSHANEFEHLSPGKFHGNGGQQTIYADRVSQDRAHLHDVFVYNHIKGRRPEVIKADSATQYFDEQYQAKYLLLSNGTRTQMIVGENDVAITKFQQMAVRLLDVDPEVEITQSFTIPTMDLFATPSASYKAQLYWRFSLPVMTMVVIFIGLALGQVNPRQGRFARLLPALVLFMVYYSTLMRLRDQIGRGVAEAEINVWLLHLAFLLLGIWLVYGKKWYQHLRLRKRLS